MHGCSYCPREFRNAWQRDEHERIAHGDLDPYDNGENR